MKMSRKYIIAFSAAIGAFMATLELTAVNVALVPMAQALKTDLSNIQWIVTASFLAVGAVIPVAGYLGNRYGLKRVFMFTLVFFTYGSLLCGLSNELGWLIAFRILQGIGGGALMPLSQAIAFGHFEPEERTKAITITAFPVLLAPVIGPSLGGLLTENLSWQWIFFMNLPLGLICFLLIWRVVPADPLRLKSKRARFDYLGLMLSMLGVTLIVYGLNLVSQTDPASRTIQRPGGSIYGWSFAPVWLLIGAGMLTLLIFALYEFRRPDPVLDLRLYRRYDFAISSLFAWITRAVSYALLLLIPIYVQQVHQALLSVQEAGLYLIPQGFGSALGLLVGMAMLKRLGIRRTVLIQLVVMIISSWPLTQLGYEMDLATLQPWLILRGFSLTAIFIPLNALAIQNLTGPLLAKGTSLYIVTLQIFSSVGVALATTLFVQQTTKRVGELALSGLPPARINALGATTGLNDVFGYALIGTILLIIPALFLPGLTVKEKPLYRRAKPWPKQQFKLNDQK